jgi:N-acetylneuraminic acid mutarotase
MIRHPLWVLGWLTLPVQALAAPPPALRFDDLPPLPGPGAAGAFAGVVGGELVVAGGTHFPDRPPWEGGKKVWADAILALDKPDGKWRELPVRLPGKRAHGVSAQWRDALVCVGGSDADGHRDDGWLIRKAGGKFEVVPLPKLPGPCALGCGAAVGDVVYVAGGLAKPDATAALHTFWELDLGKPAAEWKWVERKAWPGPDRHLAVAGVWDGALYLFGGLRLEPGPDGAPRRRTPYLRDAYRYRPAAGTWDKLADLPRSAAAAPSPAPSIPGAGLYLLGGIDDTLHGADPKNFPGLPREVLRYDPGRDAWAKEPSLPADRPRVVAPAVAWDGGWVVVSGEPAPGRRSPAVVRVTPGKGPP